MKCFLRASLGILTLFTAFVAAQEAAKSQPDPAQTKNVAEAAVAGGGGITIIAPSGTRGAGSTFNATFDVTNVNGFGIISYQGTVTYNPAVLQFNSCVTTGTISVGGFLCNQPSGPGSISFVYNHTMPLVNDGDGPPSDLFRVNFTVVGAVGTSTVLTITDLQVMEFAVPGSVTPGTITIGGTTAAETRVSGRVLTQNGRAVSGARVSLFDEAGNVSMALTNPFGYFSFHDVTAGQSYTVSISSKKYTFQPRVINVGEEVTELNFVAEP